KAPTLKKFGIDYDRAAADAARAALCPVTGTPRVPAQRQRTEEHPHPHLLVRRRGPELPFETRPAPATRPPQFGRGQPTHAGVDGVTLRARPWEGWAKNGKVGKALGLDLLTRIFTTEDRGRPGGRVPGRRLRLLICFFIRN